MKLFTKKDMERAYDCGKNDSSKYGFEMLCRDILRVNAKYREVRHKKMLEKRGAGL